MVPGIASDGTTRAIDPVLANFAPLGKFLLFGRERNHHRRRRLSSFSLSRSDLAKRPIGSPQPGHESFLCRRSLRTLEMASRWGVLPGLRSEEHTSELQSHVK